jgi:hypothetical protein
VHAEVGQPRLHLFQLERFDDGLDLLHARSSAALIPIIPMTCGSTILSFATAGMLA